MSNSRSLGLYYPSPNRTRERVSVFVVDGFLLVSCMCYPSTLTNGVSFFIKATKRQSDSQGVGSAFDGSQGVDSEDILGIPQIGFGSFQLFPDQNTCMSIAHSLPAFWIFNSDGENLTDGTDDPSLSAFNNTLQIGINWITTHGRLAQQYVEHLSIKGISDILLWNTDSISPCRFLASV